MKVLCVTAPAVGHLLPMAPLLEAMVADGDDVTVACNESMREHVERTGATFHAAGHDEAVWFERLVARTRGAPGGGLAPDRIDHYFYPRVFAEIGGDDMIDDVLACARETTPDLVVGETYALAGPLVAAAVGVPFVQHLLGPLVAPDVLELGNDAISPLWQDLGLSAPGFAGLYEHLTVEICPPSLETRSVPRGTSIRVRPSPLPVTPPRTQGRPLVYVSFGTTFMSSVELFQMVLDGLADADVDVLVTVGNDGDPDAMERVPPNATVERFVPQGALLPRCAAVVHHAGGGTMFGALAHGLPQVAIPQGADNFVNAEALASAGAAVSLLPGGVSAETVRGAVHEILDRPRYAEAARALAAEIASMPAPAEVAATLRHSVA
jgi:UDP:flavonoid glycosyltransferase YjiC (YdhE family)